MTDVNDSWLLAFAVAAEKTDSFAGNPDHVRLLDAGLIGEAGSVVAEFKKVHRERDAYPVYRNRMLEEVGDFLWYYVRIVSVLAPSLLSDLRTLPSTLADRSTNCPSLPEFLRFGASV